jgi:hypothetical protein
MSLNCPQSSAQTWKCMQQSKMHAFETEIATTLVRASRGRSGAELVSPLSGCVKVSKQASTECLLQSTIEYVHGSELNVRLSSKYTHIHTWHCCWERLDVTWCAIYGNFLEHNTHGLNAHTVCGGNACILTNEWTCTWVCLLQSHRSVSSNVHMSEPIDMH